MSEFDDIWAAGNVTLAENGYTDFADEIFTRYICKADLHPLEVAYIDRCISTFKSGENREASFNIKGKSGNKSSSYYRDFAIAKAIFEMSLQGAKWAEIDKSYICYLPDQIRKSYPVTLGHKRLEEIYKKFRPLVEDYFDQLALNTCSNHPSNKQGDE